MTRSKNGMLTNGVTYLATLPIVVLESVFPILSLGRYLLSFTTFNKLQNRDINENISFTSKNVSMECLW